MDFLYRVERYPLGWVIFGAIPVSDLAAINKLAGKKAVIAAGVSSALGATIAFAENEKNAEKWEKLVEAEIAARYGAGSPEAWLRGTDTGRSSLTIYYSLVNGKRCKKSWPGYLPLDWDDFGRCYRLLKKFPAWRARLPEVAKRFPEWEGVVKNWDCIEKAFVEAQTIADRIFDGEKVSDLDRRLMESSRSKVNSILFAIADEADKRKKK